MTTAVLIGDVVLFALGVVAGLSWPKIRAFARGEASKVAAEIKADIERKL